MRFRYSTADATLRTKIVLFSDIERDDMRPAPHSEGRFSYLDHLARPEFGRIRQLLEKWLTGYPTEWRPELCRRIQSEEDHHFIAAVFELYVNQILRCTQHQVEIHREEDAGKRPDFSATATDGAAFVLEATVVTETSDARKGAQKRENQLYDIINRLESPHFFLRWESEGQPKTPAPAKSWLQKLDKWIASLDYDAIAQRCQQGAFDLLPELRLEHEGLTVTFTPYPKLQGARSEPHGRLIGLKSSGVVCINSRDAIKKAVEKKASRYGKLNSPYLIAINEVQWYCDREEFEFALYGADGLWKPTGYAKCKGVSAVLASLRLFETTLGSADLCLYHNPFARHPYSGSLCQLHQAHWENGRVRYTKGTNAGEILGLPDGWPHVA